MANARITQVIRYFKVKQDGRGEPIPGTEDEDIWIDVEMLVGFVTEHGAGVDFKRRLWTLDQAQTERTYEWKRVFKDEENEPDTWALVGLPSTAYFESGAGISYRRFSLGFDNSSQNTARDAESFRVFHAEFGSGGKVEVDRDDYIDVEVLATYVEEYGAGLGFHREIWSPDNVEIPVWREDLERYQYKVREKSGPFDSEIANDGKPNPEKVWPSSREFVQKGNLGEIK